MSLASSFTTVFKPDRICSYESHGSVHKELTFSEFMGQSYDAGVSEKFVETLSIASVRRHPIVLADFH